MTDWRDTLRAASDMALVGILTTVAALPVVTAGAALGAASAAVHHWCSHDELPRLRTAAGWFVRGVVPGLAVAPVVAGVALLIAGNLAAIRAGIVPGGGFVVAATLVAMVALGGVGGVSLVRAGQGGGWRAARDAVPGDGRGVAEVAGCAGVLALATVLAVLMPATLPVLVGFTVFGLHVVVRRVGGPRP